MKTVKEIEKIFTLKGCTVVVNSFDQSCNGGGDIFIIAPGVDAKKGYNFTMANFGALESANSNSREYQIYLITAGTFIKCTSREYDLAPIGHKICFWSAGFWVDKSYSNSKEEFYEDFKILGIFSGLK